MTRFRMSWPGRAGPGWASQAFGLRGPPELRKGASKCMVFHWFYKLLRLGVHRMRKAALDNAFPTILEFFFAFWAKIHPFDLGFIWFCERIFRRFKKWFSRWFYKVLTFGKCVAKCCSSECFSMILEAFSHFAQNFIHLTLVFIRFCERNFRRFKK